ncbi:DUF7344 domain-containing protein [Natronorubrum daqingense]|uniref:DUF7344 domain-containing protein n=1 Tax=Natronorubrum daqingense TaxID=588898 RepID=A0A1N7EPN3_9EURY|nr:hypothetical protein [Natronorubrum daqingense]APX97812.1 hypothetical protein BB347_14950 [Natronorubrum daqingense]SIR90051.1 hypothetical protein SAMN05421809_2764 [Natronorubrum daqingense]
MPIHTDRLATVLDRHAPGSRDHLEHALPREAVRRVLDSDRRREVLRCLLAEEGPLQVRTLVARVADAEHDATAITSLLDVRQRVHVSLCRTHLPLLEQHELLSYDRACGLVAPDVSLPAFESALECDLERPITTRLDLQS